MSDASKIDDGEVPMPSRKELTAALDAAIFAKNNKGRVTDEELGELIEAAKWSLHAIPDELDFIDLTTKHPINQVYFRAGLLACREYMARFVEQGGDAATAASIRANWWPRLGEDPGQPRLFDFDEVAEEVTIDGKISWKSKAISPNVEALPRAYQFLLPASAASKTGGPEHG